MVDLSRRKFLGAAAAAPIAVPFAARHAMTQQTAGIANNAGWIGEVCAGHPEEVSSLHDALRKLGYVPEYMRKRWRDQSRNVLHLDPDIASMRSISDSAKIQIQRRRNYESLESEFWGHETSSALYKEFEKLVGDASWRF